MYSYLLPWAALKSTSMVLRYPNLLIGSCTEDLVTEMFFANEGHALHQREFLIGFQDEVVIQLTPPLNLHANF